MNNKIQIDQEDKETTDFKEDMEALFQDLSPSFFQKFINKITDTFSKPNNSDPTM